MKSEIREMAEQVFINDKLVDADNAAISIFDSGLTHGAGLFETLRSYNGKVFRIDDHINNLFASAKKLGMQLSHSPENIKDAISQILKANELDNARIRLTITPGSFRNITKDSKLQSTLIITATAMTAYPDELYDAGMLVVIANQRQNPTDPTAGLQTLNNFPRLIALQEAQIKKAGEAIWFTPTNRLADACMSNVFLVHGDTVTTPPLDTPVFDGVARKVILEICREKGIECIERELGIQDITSASEMFLANTIMELMPVRQFEAHKFSDEPGEVYKLLHACYRDKTE
ncbi:MAG: aminotransferase class IV family protein [Phycisphaerae bacterium]|nr:aminotransferase class IV family protein [Phycisphaerae bacterium]